MDFDKFREKVKASAAAAVEAASKIPDFDQMAANDDYIHSEGLNVKKKKNTATTSNSAPSLPGSNDTKPRATYSAQQKSGLFSMVDSIIKEKSSTTTTAEMSGNPQAGPELTTASSSAAVPNSGFEDSDDEDDDPILRLVRITKPKGGHGKSKDEADRTSVTPQVPDATSDSGTAPTPLVGMDPTTMGHAAASDQTNGHSELVSEAFEYRQKIDTEINSVES